MSKAICMFVTNPVSTDPRVKREARTLAGAGYRVTVVGLQKGDTTREDWEDGYRIIRLQCPVPLLAVKRRWPTLYGSVQRWYRRLTRRPLHDEPCCAEQQSVPEPSRPSIWWRLYVDLYDIITIFWLNLTMAREVVRQQADLYHAHDLDTLLAGYLAKRRSGKPLIYDFHELYTEQFAKGVKTPLWKAWYTVLECLLVKSVDHTITVCDALADWMARRYRGPRTIILRNVPTGQPVSALHIVHRREKVVLFHGGYARDRGLEQLIESGRYLHRGRIALRGFGELEQPLRRLVKDLGVEDRVVFEAPVPMAELVAHASAADVGVLPYLPVCLNNRYCLPNKIFEYMMAGLAVAASDLPELSAIVHGYDLGLVFDPHDPKDIARVLNELLNDDVALEKRRRNAFEAARTVFRWDRESEQLLKLYDRIFSTSTAR